MSYGTPQGLEDYADTTGRTIPSSSNLQAALNVASNYIDGLYWDDFCGEPASIDAAFPRKGSTVIPTRLINAVYEAALLWLTDADSLSGGGSASGQVIKERVEGAVEVQYASPTGDFVADSTPRYSMIEGMLKPLICLPLEGTGGFAMVV